MKQFLHILPANAPQSTIPLISRLMSDVYSELDNFFIIYGKTDEIVRERYNILSKYKQKVQFCRNTWEFCRVLSNTHTNIVVCHSDSYVIRMIPLIMGYDVSWVCWGATTNLSGSILSYLTYPLKYLINHSLTKIVTLMLSDQNDLCALYRLKNVETLPYTTTIDDVGLKMCYFNKKSHYPVKVLIGNSGHCYPWYNEIIEDLSKFKDRIEVHCMFQYPCLPEKIQELEKYGMRLLGDMFKVDTELLPLSSYYDYMSSFDIYICPKQSQSGLGAVHVSLFFGKKVYVRGKNFDWENHIGTKVYDVDSIKEQSFEQFVQELTLTEKEFNRNLILKHWNRDSEWLEFYRKL